MEKSQNSTRRCNILYISPKKIYGENGFTMSEKKGFRFSEVDFLRYLYREISNPQSLKNTSKIVFLDKMSGKKRFKTLNLAQDEDQMAIS